MKNNPPALHAFKSLLIYLQEGCDSLRYMERITREYGDMVHLKIGWKNNYLFNHPDLIEKILLAGYQVRRSTPPPMKRVLGKGLICSFGVPAGDRHRTMRQLIQPFFQKQSVSEMGGLMVEYAEAKMREWKDGDIRDMEEEMIHLALGIILKVLVGTDFHDDIHEVAKATAVMHKNGNATPQAIWNIHMERIPFVGKRTELGRARKYLDGKIYELIRSRREANDLEGKDFLSMLLRYQKDNAGRGYVTDKQIRDEIMTMLTAGHETISSALAWTWYLLSENPEAEQKLHEELDAVLKGKSPAAEDIPKMRYTRMIFSETMRLYPPVWSSARRPVNDLDIRGYTIPKDSCVYFSQYLVHRDPRFFPQPERFDPERFSPEETLKRPKFAYFPFGAGNRQCIGEGFAWTEGILLIAALAQKWRFRFVPGHPIQLKPLIALQPKFGIKMVLEKRIFSPILSPSA